MKFPRILLPVMLVAGLPAAADWWLWETPTDDEAHLGPAQTTFTRYNVMQGGHGVGQSFVPTEEFIYRLDFMLSNQNDQRPLMIKMWKWADEVGSVPGCTEDAEYDATVARAPIWEDSLRLHGPTDRVLRSFFPRVPVEAGAPYYVEFGHTETDGQWGAFAAWQAEDPYANGMLRVNDRFRYEESCFDLPMPDDHADMYFKIYHAAGSSASEPTCADGAPGPCFSPDESWSPPTAPGPPITADDYRSILVTKAAQRDGVLAGDGHNAYRFTMYDAFLYEVDGTAQNAESSIQLFRKAYEYRSDHLGGWTGFPWMERPGWAYEWIRDYPSLAPADRALIKSLLLHSAAGFWPERELGAFNHGLGGAVTFQLVTALIDADEFDGLSGCAVTLPAGVACLFQPGEQLTASDHAAWLAYADEVWGDFTAHWDFTEDTHHYNLGRNFRYVMQIDRLRVELNGETSIWDQDGFRELVERYYRVHPPLGPNPVYGDTAGWNQEWATPALVFETAAARFQDPRYRWLAYRLFDYERAHIHDTTTSGSPLELWQAVYNEYPSFAFAYLGMDGTLATTKPAPQSESQGASQDQDGTLDWTVASHGLGQTFLPLKSPLVRLDLMADNLGDTSPATLRLWKWADSGYAATVASTPLYEDSLDLSGAVGYRIRSVFPFLDLTDGERYFFELRRDTAFLLQGGGTTRSDPYPDGHVYSASIPLPPLDLWFRTYSLTPDGSLMTLRREAHTQLNSEVGNPPHVQVFGDAYVPDKLVLRSGYDPQDLYAMFNLITDYYGHGQVETGALVSLSHDGSLLVTGSGYFDKREKDDSSNILRRYWDGTPATAADVSAVEVTDHRLASVASIRWDDLRGWDIDRERRIMFVKNRMLLVRDGFVFDSDVTASAGTIWHADDLRPQRGPNWYELYNRAPRGINGFQYKNPEQYLLTWFVDRGYSTEAREVAYTGNPPSSPYVVGQRWTGTVAGGTSRWFDTVLRPHGPEITAQAAAAGVSTRYDDGTNVAVRVAIDDEIWTLVDNPGGITIDTGDLVTDATYLITRTAAGAPYVLAHQAGQVYVNDGNGAVIDMSWPVDTTVELVGAVAACPAVVPCGGVSCVPGPQLDNTDTGINLCATPAGGLLHCGAGKTVHVVESTCEQAPCPLRKTPSRAGGNQALEPRPCPIDCATGKTLVCQ